MRSASSRGPAGRAGRGPSRGPRPSARLRPSRPRGRAVDADREARDDDRAGLRERRRRSARRSRRPASVGRRVPTIATAWPAASASTSPRTNRTCGGSSIERSLERVRGVLEREDLDARDLDATEHGPGILGDRRDRPGRRRVERLALVDDAGLDEPPGRARPQRRLEDRPARPERPSSAPNPTGPRPSTDVSTAHAWRSVSRAGRLRAAVAGVTGSPASAGDGSADVAHAPVGPPAPTPIISSPPALRGPTSASGTGRPPRGARRATAGAPPRSAIVRATRSSRSVPRPDNASRSASSIARRAASGLSRTRSAAARGPTAGRSAGRCREPAVAPARRRSARRPPRNPPARRRRSARPAATRGIVTHRSIRSRSGPETRPV